MKVQIQTETIEFYAVDVDTLIPAEIREHHNKLVESYVDKLRKFIKEIKKNDD